MPRVRTTHSIATDSYTAPQFTAHPADVVAAPAGSATLQCAVTGEPAPSVAWYKEDGGAVATGARVSVSSSGELTISNVMLSDAGKYYCVASNAVGSVRSLSASLDIAGNKVCVCVCAHRPPLYMVNDVSLM